jgi:hypothetical protein
LSCFDEQISNARSIACTEPTGLLAEAGSNASPGAKSLEPPRGAVGSKAVSSSSLQSSPSSSPVPRAERRPCVVGWSPTLSMHGEGAEFRCWFENSGQTHDTCVEPFCSTVWCNDSGRVRTAASLPFRPAGRFSLLSIASSIWCSVYQYHFGHGSGTHGQLLRTSSCVGMSMTTVCMTPVLNRYGACVYWNV